MIPHLPGAPIYRTAGAIHEVLIPDSPLFTLVRPHSVSTVPYVLQLMPGLYGPMPLYGFMSVSLIARVVTVSLVSFGDLPRPRLEGID